MADDVLVVTGGLGITTAALLGLAAVAPQFIQWGVGTTGPVTANTDLETKTGCGEARVAGVDSQETTTLTNDTYQTVGTLTKAAAGAAITEVGTFNSAGTGSPPADPTLFLRATFDAINLVIGNSIEFTIGSKFVGV